MQTWYIILIIQHSITIITIYNSGIRWAYYVISSCKQPSGCQDVSGVSSIDPWLGFTLVEQVERSTDFSHETCWHFLLGNGKYNTLQHSKQGVLSLPLFLHFPICHPEVAGYQAERVESRYLEGNNPWSVVMAFGNASASRQQIQLWSVANNSGLMHWFQLMQCIELNYNDHIKYHLTT